MATTAMAVTVMAPSSFLSVSRRWAVALLAALAISSVEAANWTFTPQISGTETYTDNVALSSSGQQSDFVTEISPRIVVHGTSTRLKLDADYALQEIIYAKDGGRNRTQNALGATGSLEAVEHFFFVDASARISQQSVSAFGPQVTSNANDTGNRTETRLFSISPYIRSNLKDWVAYEVRYNAIRTASKSDAISNSSSDQWTAHANNLATLANFGWALDYSRRTVGFTGSRDSDLESARASLTYQVDPQFRVTADVGREKNNYGLATQSYSNHGIGFDWQPTPRTKVSAQREQRFFGSGYHYNFTHRTALTAWSLGYVRDITTTADQLQVNIPSDAYLLLFNSPRGIASYPDPAVRDIKTKELLSLVGIPASLGTATLLANRVFLQRRLDASGALIGVNNSVTLAASRSQLVAISGLTGGGVDIFNQSSDITQRTLSLSWNSKLSAVSSVNLNLLYLNSEGTAPVAQDSTQRSVVLSLLHQFGPKTNGSLGLRHVNFDAQGASSSYSENAVTGTLSVSF